VHGLQQFRGFLICFYSRICGHDFPQSHKELQGTALNFREFWWLLGGLTGRL